MDTLRAKALAYRRSATHDGLAVTDRARQVYRDSFSAGHGCSMCGPTVTIPADLSPVERTRRGEALRRMHFANLTLAANRARTQKRTPALAKASAQEVDRVSDPTPTF